MFCIAIPSSSILSLIPLCYEMVPREKTISCTFINLIENIQEYNMERTMLLWETGTQTNRHLYK